MTLTTDGGIPYTYLIVKLSNGRYENWGAYTMEGISVAINEAVAFPYVKGVVFSNNPYEANNRNRMDMLRFWRRFAFFSRRGLSLTTKGEVLHRS
jgi:hypothetical protein